MGSLMMKEWSPKEIRALAYEKILTPLWRRQREFALGAEPSPLELLPMPCERIITQLANLKLDEPEEIIPDRGPDPKAGYQIACKRRGSEGVGLTKLSPIEQ
jgi:hypothetical protein